MFKKLSVLICFVLILGLASNTFGQDRTWDNGDPCDNFWSSAQNWKPNQVPNHGNKNTLIAMGIGDSNHCEINSTARTQGLNVGKDGSDGELWLTSGSLSSGKTVGAHNKAIRFGNNANALVKVYSGWIKGKPIVIGFKAGSTSTLVEMSGGSITSASGLQVGNQGYGHLDVSGGDITSGALTIGLKGTGIVDLRAGAGDVNCAIFSIGSGAAGDGTLTLHSGYGGTIDVGTALNTKAMRIGYQGGATGWVDMSDGTINVSGNLNIGAQADSTGTLTMSGGTINVGQEMRVGSRDANGFVTMSGGTINVANDLLVGRTFTPGDLNLPAIPGTGSLTMTSGLLAVADTNTIYIGTEGSTGIISLSGDAVLEGGDLVIGAPGSGGTLDMCGAATLILAGNDLMEVVTFINSGLITVCGYVVTDEWPGWVMDFNIRNAGMTTVTVPEPATIALLGLGGLVMLRRKRR